MVTKADARTAKKISKEDMDMIIFYLIIIIAVFTLITKTLPDIDPGKNEDARTRYYRSGYGSRSNNAYQN